MNGLRALPQMSDVLLIPEISSLARLYSRDLVVDWAREAVDEIRAELSAGKAVETGEDGKVSRDLISRKVLAKAAASMRPSLKRVINATGIVIHTNLGRAPLSEDLIDSISQILGSYSNLEFDLATGERGSRHSHLERLIPLATGAESGFVVNNNAAAVLVVLSALAAGREVIVSRGELIEIGGSFRIPEIITAGGARLREVGTTNKTRIGDYEKAVTSDTALLLKVHTSNYRIQGFTEEAPLANLVKLGRDMNIPVAVDLGSGLLADLAPYGITEEKPVRWYLEAGADIVTFSGDKLLGGPQAGFIVGRREIVERIKKHPLVRALRVGKLTIAPLETMLRTYLSSADLREKIPALKLITAKPDELKAAADSLAALLRDAWPGATISLEPDEAFAGGGSLPAVPLPTFIVIVEAPGIKAGDLARALREAEIPVIGRIKSGRFCLDLRSIQAGEDMLIAATLRTIREAK